MPFVRVTAGWTERGFDLHGLGWDNLLSDSRAIAVYTSDGTLLAVNDPMLDLLGWAIEDVERRGWIACLYPDPGEQLRTLHNTNELSRAGALPRRHTRAANRGDGSLIVLDLLSTPVQLPDGRRAVFTVAADATRRSVPLGRGFRELVEDAPDILSRFDARTGACVFISSAAERVLGYGPSEFYKRPQLVRERLLASSRGAFREAIRTVESGAPCWVVLEFHRKDDTVVTLHQALYPICDVSGHVVVIEGVARDISALRALERRLEDTVEELKAKNAELSSLDRLKSQLLGSVSHELRTPLVTIKGYNELMMRGSLGPVTPRQRRALETSGGSIDRLADLIETLLDFARREEGRLTLRRARIDARVALREAVEHYGARIADKGLTLSVELGRRPLVVDGDSARLGQVLRALLSNAAKFTDAPGEVRVVADQLGDHVELRVTDSGIGIPAGLHDKIFDRFFQVDASMTRRFGGAGLGLALAREIVSLHEGTIHVDSEPGRGSTFTVRLPVASLGRSTHSGRSRSDRPVLLLGAPPAALGDLHARLEAEGMVVIEATSGHEVQKRARRHRPDAVVLALDADLLDTIAALHHDPDTTSMPVIAMVDAWRREAALPIADYVVNTNEAPRLAEAVRRLLGRPLPGGPAPRPARVLVVDDEPSIVDFTRFVLEAEGYEVRAAASGEAALNLVSDEDGAVDLVLLDVALEGLDGIEVCRRLKARPETAHVPVLIVTALSGDRVRHSAFEAGAAGVVNKPFGVDEFLRLVRLHLPRAEARDPGEAALDGEADDAAAGLPGGLAEPLGADLAEPLAAPAAQAERQRVRPAPRKA